ncbi:MAG: rod shape-determining protein [Lentisphaeria bacterium]|nr:rod shape-determining protein [Lentisphaeria bacterium]
MNNFFSNDIGIDLGTANCLVFVRGQGVVLDEPSVVAVDNDSNKVLAVGIEAKRMLGRTPGNIRAVRPMKEGVIADFNITESMLRYFINKVRKRPQIMRPRLVVAVPTGITEVESKAVEQSAKKAGCREVITIFEPMAAAIGVGLPVSEPSGNMIVDIGGGTSEIAVISLSGIVECRSVRTGGDSMDDAIIRYIKRAYSMMIGERTAEAIKIDIGSAYPLQEELTMEIKGRDMNGGLPKAVSITSEEIREALQESVTNIVDGVRVCLEKCPPELAADLIDHGIVLAGGGGQLRGLDQLIAEETGLPVIVADDPLRAVARGTGVYLEGLGDQPKPIQ